MKSSEHKITNKKLSMIISAGYVLAGTIHALNNPVKIDALYYLFWPVSIIPSMILFAESDPFGYLLLVQLVTWGILYWIIYGLTFLIRGKNRLDS